MVVNKKRVMLLILITVYKILLDISYVLYVNRVYEYMGFIYNLNVIKLFESYIFVLLIAVYLPLNESKPSTIALNTLLFVMVVPFLSVYALKDEYRLYTYAFVVCFLLTISFIKILPNMIINQKFNLNRIIIYVLFLMGLVVYGTLIIQNGIPTLALLDISKVYEVRGTVKYGNDVIRYLVNWQANIVNIFFIILLWVKREKKMFVVMCLLQILMYLITSHKAYLFYPIIIPFIMYIVKKRKYIIGSIAGVIASIVLSLLLFFSNINVFAGSLVINRTLFLPAQISFQYYEYFSESGFVLLSHSILSFLFDTPLYNTNPILIIGGQYYSNNWANTGYLGDAYMNFGIIGMVIFSLIFAVILKIFDSLATTELKKLITSGFMVVMMLLFTNGALLTNLFFGGILFYIFLLWLYDDKKYLILEKTNENKAAGESRLCK